MGSNSLTGTDAINSYARSVNADITQLCRAINGMIRFGVGTTGTNGENIYGQWLQITTNATPNTESTFTHTMGNIPVGYIITWQDKAGNLYQGPTTGTLWTANTISLKCTVASVTFSLFLLQ